MGTAVTLGTDDTASALRRLAKASSDAKQTRRLLALAAIYDGDSPAMAARIGGVGLQIVRDWVVRFNAEGPAGLIDRKAPGKAPGQGAASDGHATPGACRRGRSGAAALGRDGVVRWRLIDLAQGLWEAFGLWEEFGVSVSRQTLGRELRTLVH